MTTIKVVVSDSDCIAIDALARASHRSRNGMVRQFVADALDTLAPNRIRVAASIGSSIRDDETILVSEMLEALGDKQVVIMAAHPLWKAHPKLMAATLRGLGWTQFGRPRIDGLRITAWIGPELIAMEVPERRDALYKYIANRPAYRRTSRGKLFPSITSNDLQIRPRNSFT